VGMLFLEKFFCFYQIFNTLVSGCFWGFSRKKHLNACGFAREFLRSGQCYKPGERLKRCGKSSSPHFFWLGVQIFCE